MQPRREPELRVRAGVDLVAVGRMERLLAASPDAGRSLLTAGELAASAGRRRPAEHVAARFAAKEAVLKALGTGLGPGLRGAAVAGVGGRGGGAAGGRPGEVAAVAQRRGLASLDVSLTHTAGLALAHVVAVFDSGRAACAST